TQENSGTLPEESHMQQQVVITGLGVLAANGIGKDQFWKACIAGRSGIQRITRFDASMLPTQIAGEIAAFDPAAYGLTWAACARLERGTQLALAAAHLALEDAGLTPDVPEEECVRTGVYLGAAMASVEAGEKLWKTLTRDRTHAPTTLLDETQATTLRASFVPSNTIAAPDHLHRPCCTIATGGSAGADALRHAILTMPGGRAEP